MNNRPIIEVIPPIEMTQELLDLISQERGHIGTRLLLKKMTRQELDEYILLGSKPSEE